MSVLEPSTSRAWPFKSEASRLAEPRLWKAATFYTQHALVLNVPLNNDLNHRFFEVMAARVAQMIA